MVVALYHLASQFVDVLARIGQYGYASAAEEAARTGRMEVLLSGLQFLVAVKAFTLVHRLTPLRY